MGNPDPDEVAAVRRVVADRVAGGRVDSVVAVGEGTGHLAPAGSRTGLHRSRTGGAGLPQASGVPLLDLPRRGWSVHGGAIAATLGELLAALGSGRDAYIDNSLAAVAWLFPPRAAVRTGSRRPGRGRPDGGGDDPADERQAPVALT